MVDKKEETNYKYIVTVVAIALTLGLVIIFTAGRYSWSEMKKASAETKVQKAILTEADTRLENLKSLSSRTAELREKNQKVLSALPQDKNISALFVQFEQIATASGLEISSVSESGAAAASTNSQLVRTATYTVDAKAGDYTALKNALSKFETALRVLAMPQISVTGTSESGLSVQFTITTYLRGE
jgi:Tfp pilus assembly protein PilO